MPNTMTLCHSGGSQVLAIDTTIHMMPKDQREFSVMIDLATVLNSPHKIIEVKVHELLPYLIFIVTNIGIYTLYYERYTFPPFGYSSMFTSTVALIAGSSPKPSHFYYCFTDQNLQADIFAIDDDNNVISQSSKFDVASKIIGKNIDLKVSPSGKYLSVFSKQTGLYDIFSVFNDQFDPLYVPERLKSGYTTHLVWHSKYDRYAVICPINEDDTTGSFSSIISKILLLVYEIAQGRVAMIYRGDDMPNPTGIFGGNLLGVSKELDGISMTSFYSWETIKHIGVPFPEPSYIFWTDLYCIISYKTDFYVYSNYPSFEYICRINQSIRAGYWSYSVFFYTTDTDLYWLLPCLKTPYLLASHGIDINQELCFQSEVVNLKEDKEIAELYRKPHEACSILCVFQGKLILVNTSFQLFTVPIDSIFLRFCMLVGAGFTFEALPLTLKMHEMLQPKIAICLDALGIPQAALELPNLPYETKISICIRNGIPIALVTAI